MRRRATRIRALGPPRFCLEHGGLNVRGAAFRGSFPIPGAQRGAVALLVALALPVLIGILGLGIDVSYWAMTRMELQRTADLASVAGAMRYGVSQQVSDALGTAATVAELNGLPAGTRGGAGTDTLTDMYGPYAATVTFAAPSTIIVSITQAVPRMFSGLFLSSATQPVSARAVAKLAQRSNGAVACVLALSSVSFTVLNGNASLQMPGCDLRTNGSLTINGTPSVNVSNLIAGGTITQNGNSTCSAVTCVQGAPQESDPYSSLYKDQLSLPAKTIQLPQGQTTLNPPPAGDAYSWSLNGGTYTLNPGIYYINGDFNVNGNVTLTGTGVTIITNGNVNINGNADVNLTAPATGGTAGLLFGSTNSAFQLNGGSAISMTGSIYAPNANLIVNGSNSASGNCLYIVASTVTFNGGGQFSDSNCQASGMTPIYDFSGVASLVQ